MPNPDPPSLLPRFLIAMLAAASSVAGCSSATPADAMAGRPAITPIVMDEQTTVGRSVDGRPIHAHVIGPSDAPTVLIVASIHGDEPAGTPLVEMLLAHLRAEPRALGGRRVVIVPVANPDGYERRARLNRNGIDLNRNFPADNWRAHRRHGAEAVSEPETVALLDVVERYRPHRIISIHQPVACIDYDGPAEPIATAMGAVCDLPVRKLGTRPGSMGSYLGVGAGLEVVTLELPGGATGLDRRTLWERYGAAMLVSITGP